MLKFVFQGRSPLFFCRFHRYFSLFFGFSDCIFHCFARQKSPFRIPRPILLWCKWAPFGTRSAVGLSYCKDKFLIIRRLRKVPKFFRIWAQQWYQSQIIDSGDTCFFQLSDICITNFIRCTLPIFFRDAAQSFLFIKRF